MDDGIIPPHIQEKINQMNKNYKSRPVERQAPVLEALLEYWQLRPDWRLGQLLWNLNSMYSSPVGNNDRQVSRLWNREEGEWLRILREAIEDAS